MDKEKKKTSGSVVLAYILLFITIVIMAFASLIKYDIIFTDITNKNTADKGDDKDTDKTPQDVITQMSCSYTDTSSDVTEANAVVYTFENNKLKKSRTISTVTASLSDNKQTNYNLYVAKVNKLKDDYTGIDGIVLVVEDNDGIAVVTKTIDYAQIKNEQLIKEDGTIITIEPHLDQTLTEVKGFISNLSNITCDK